MGPKLLSSRQATLVHLNVQTCSNCSVGDIICTFLGCHIPVILRQKTEDTYEFVGECYLHGIMNGESFLGPLPHPWRVRPVKNVGGIDEISYCNMDTNETTQEDPRLDSLPPNWEKFTKDWTREDPIVAAYYRNILTGKIVNSDPRMLPHALVARGIQLEQFILV